MKYTAFLLAILILAPFASGQSVMPEPAKNANLVADRSPRSESTPSPTTKGDGGRIRIPAEKASPIHIPHFAEPIVIDGRIDEAPWANAAIFKDFYQVQPGNNTAASKPTEVLMMYDEKHLYLAFKCWDDKGSVRASVADRDNVFGEDNVRVWLDTYDDQRRAYVLGFNPLGIQQDGIFTEGQGADFSMDIVMESKGIIEDWGWSVEVKIPFKSLRYSAGNGKHWGFNAARNIDRLNDEMDHWLPDDRNISGFLIKHGRITGFDNIKYERTLELIPSVTVSETGRRKRTLSISAANAEGYDPIFFPIGVRDPGRFVNDPIETELGLNLKYTISPNITLTAALNPDFAEIEADAPVVTANQRFPIFFQEKRPFFLEGKDIFDTPLSAFYSRAIVDPDAAVKLSGKIGRNSFGFLAASDNAPGNYSLDEMNDPVIGRRIAPFVGKNAFFSVLRVKRDIGSEHSLGFIGTARIFPENRNFAGGIDGKVKLNAATVLTFQVLGTHSRKYFYDPLRDRSEYRTGNGIGYFLNLDKTEDLSGWTLEFSGRSRDYRTDSGFTERVDTNMIFFANRFSTKTKPENAVIRVNWTQFGRYRFDWRGRTQMGLVGTGLNFNFRGNAYGGLETGFLMEKIYEDEFGPTRDLSIGRNGAFAGSPERSSIQPYFSLNTEKRFNEHFYAWGFIGSIFNAFDYDFGGGDRYPRVSPAFLGYVNGPEYNDYIRDLYAHQADPTMFPLPNLPQPPALDPGKGWQFDAEFGIEYVPVDSFRASLEYMKSRLRRNDTGETAFDTNIFVLRSRYQFTRFLFTRLRVDYDTLRSNVGGQFLFGWTPNPGTAFYVGYNDNFNYNGFSPYTRHAEPGFERNSRTFFIRASYLFRKSF